MCARTAPPPPTPQPTRMCVDADGGATDQRQGTCKAYRNAVIMCGFYDDADFTAAAMCCACGGGGTPSAAPTFTAEPTGLPTPMPTFAPVIVATWFDVVAAVENAAVRVIEVANLITIPSTHNSGDAFSATPPREAHRVAQPACLTTKKAQTDHRMGRLSTSTIHIGRGF